VQKNAKYLDAILRLPCNPIENLIIPNERAAFLELHITGLALSSNWKVV
jgi:hypothetical protein